MSPIAPEALDRLHGWLADRPRRAFVIGMLALTSPITVPLAAWAIYLGVTL